MLPQTAAGSLTLLYKDSLEELRKAAEINRKLVGLSVLGNFFWSLCNRVTREPGWTWQHGQRASADLFAGKSCSPSSQRTPQARCVSFKEMRSFKTVLSCFICRARVRVLTDWVSPTHEELLLCCPVYKWPSTFKTSNHPCLSPRPILLCSLCRTCWTSRASLPATGSARPPLPHSKMKRWNILPNRRDPEKIEVSSSFSQSPNCSFSGKMSYNISSQRGNLLWLGKLTTKTCQLYVCASNDA